VLERLHYWDEKLSNEVKDLNAKLVVETTRYEMQSKVLKTHNQLLAFSWIFFYCLCSCVLGQLLWCI
jgi:uncharacterized membrane protein (DUF106 family)